MKRRLLFYGLLAVLLGAAWFAFALHAPYRGFARDGVFVEIPRGASTRAIARLLAEKGVVRSRVVFEAVCRWHAGRPLQAGEYFFKRPLTPLEVFRDLADGHIYVRSVTVPEGLNMFEIAALMEKEGLSQGEEFLAAARDPSPIRDLAPRARNLEGFLFPATYQFPRRVTPQQIIAAMLRRFRKVWDAFPVTGRNPHRFSPAEVVTLASLVERETRTSEERAVIAGVFYNRLRLRRALQCDPTVLYAMQLAGKNDGIIHQSDLRIRSPYNTYRYPGLPPGPIANPSHASLRAALYPAQVDYFYFVSDTQGGHFFSKTLREHNSNVARYRRLLAQAGSRNPR